MKNKFCFLCICASLSIFSARAQTNFSGSLQLQQNFFVLDSSVLSRPIPPQYYKQLSSTDAWLDTRFEQNGFTVGARFDLFNNSNLRNPYNAYSAQGLGFWYITKPINDFEITAGYFYEQFGSGIIFRAYEARAQALDYGIQGIRAKYKYKNTTFKAFTGKQKQLFATYLPIIKGANIENFFSIGKQKNINIAPCIGIVNRTLDQATMDIIVSEINADTLKNRFVPKYNAYAYTLYNTITYKNFSWYAELALKSPEAVLNTANNKFENQRGKVFYTNLSYSKQGFGLTVQYKRTNHFDFRIAPTQVLNNGLLGFIPPLSRFNTLPLTARYLPATQLVGEQGVQADVVLNVKQKHLINFNGSYINDLRGNALYRELYIDDKFKLNKNLKLTLGLQHLMYNIAVYQFKPQAANVRTITAFSELTYKISRTNSIRAELSHLSTKQDFGSWAQALLEFNIAPKYSFSVSDMYNYGNKLPEKRLHYYSIFGAANLGKTRVSAGYVRQVEGVNCTGGICRLEPAFNGIKVGLSSRF